MRHFAPKGKKEEEAHMKDSLDVNDPEFMVRLLTMADAEKDAPRMDDYVHLSSLLRVECPRALYLRQLVVDSENARESVNSATRVVWAIGRGIEAHVREQMIKAVGFTNSIGKWRCACGKSTLEGTGDPTLSCRYCKTPLNIYEEITLRDHKKQVSGHPDFAFWHNGYVYPVEFKSIKKDDFLVLDAARLPPKYRRQLFGYGVLFRRNGYKVGPHGFIIFVNKDFTWEGTPYKSFHIPFTDGVDQQVLRGLFDLAGELRHVRQLKASGEDILSMLPPRLAVCSGTRTPTARRCDMCSYCFLYDNNGT